MTQQGAWKQTAKRGFVTVAMLGVAACSSTAVRKAPEAAAPAAAAPVAQAPRVEAGPAQHRVALLVPTTGGNAAVGQSIANAANMALLDSNVRDIKLTVYNTAGGASVAAARALADGNKIFLGPLLAPDVRAVQAAAAGAGVPILSFSNDATLAGGNTYVMGFQPQQSIARVVGFARSRGVQNFAGLIPAGDYGQRVSSAFVRSVQANGGKVTSIETYPRDPKRLAAAARRVTNYEARVAKVAQAGVVRADGTVAPVQQRLGPVSFQALLIGDSGSVAPRFLPALQQFGASGVRILGTELWNNEPGLSGVSGMHGAWFAAVPDNRFQQLATRYRSQFGGAPSRLASMGYDAVLLVHSLGDKWKIGEPFPRNQLNGDEGFTGIDGIFRFQNGVAERGLEVQQVGPGGFSTVSPAPRAFRNAQVGALKIN